MNLRKGFLLKSIEEAFSKEKKPKFNAIIKFLTLVAGVRNIAIKEELSYKEMTLNERADYQQKGGMRTKQFFCSLSELIQMNCE